MEGKTPFEKLRDLGHNSLEESALFPLVILDTMSTDWLLETGNGSASSLLLPLVVL